MLADPTRQDVAPTCGGGLRNTSEQRRSCSTSTDILTTDSDTLGRTRLWRTASWDLRTEITRPYRMLFDLTAIDERQRFHRQDQPASDFTVVYHLLSYERNADVRIKVPLTGGAPRSPR